jgi:transposase-like protein
MPENDRLSGCSDDINLEFVEREVTPRLLMNFSIQLHVAELSISNTVLFFYIFGANRVRATVHNCVHKAGLQPETGRIPNHVAVDATVIRLDNEQYWLYAAVDHESNELLHTKLERRERTLLPKYSSANFARNTTSTTLSFSLMALLH